MGTRWWPELSTLTDELCAPPRSPEPGEEISDPEFSDDDQPQWWEPYEDTTESILGTLTQPIRLSQLLARARDLEVADYDGQPLDPDLLAAAIVHAAHRAWATHLSGRAAEEHLVVAVATGEAIDADGIRSQDLLLVPAVVATDIDTPTGSSVPGQLLVDDLDDVSRVYSNADFPDEVLAAADV